MPQPPEIEADQVHVLEAGPVRRSRLGLVLGLVAIAGLAGGGAWIATADPFASRAAPTAPPAAAGNLLGDAWSFETTETAGPSQHWVVPDDAPGGFLFGADGAVSGSNGARAETTEEGWVRMLTAQSWRVGSGTGRIEVAAVSGSASVQLLLRFEADGRPPIDVVVASGQGAIAGSAPLLPGYSHVRAGVGCLGQGTVDDVELREVAAGSPGADGGTPAPGQVSQQGVFAVYAGDPPGLSVFRGDELALRIEPASLATAAGQLPAAASFFPGESAVALPDGGRVGLRPSLREADRRLVLSADLSGVPAGTTIVHTGFVAGALAEAPLGIRSARGFERFAGDFRVEGVDALVLGRTQDRLVIQMDGSFAVSASHRADGTIALQLERPGMGDVAREVVMQAEFKEERVTAAQLRDKALADEGAGLLGDALAALDTIASEYPYDEEVLEAALLARGRLQSSLQQRLAALDDDLEDALFLGSARRCREVLDEALAAAATYAGSDAEALFRDIASQGEERAARLLEEDLSRRRGRIEALAGSFEAHGDYPLVTRELRDSLTRFFAAEGGEP